MCLNYIFEHVSQQLFIYLFSKRWRPIDPIGRFLLSVFKKILQYTVYVCMYAYVCVTLFQYKYYVNNRVYNDISKPFLSLSIVETQKILIKLYLLGTAAAICSNWVIGLPYGFQIGINITLEKFYIECLK